MQTKEIAKAYYEWRQVSLKSGIPENEITFENYLGWLMTTFYSDDQLTKGAQDDN